MRIIFFIYNSKEDEFEKNNISQSILPKQQPEVATFVYHIAQAESEQWLSFSP